MFDLSTNPKRKYFLTAFLSAAVFIVVLLFIVYGSFFLNKGFLILLIFQKINQ